MSSLKMTFSLASLILIFGLVFVPISVMAHDNASGDDATTPRPHDHPLSNDLAAATTADDITAGIAGIATNAHRNHPTVESIMLKAGDSVKGKEAKIAADPANTFTLVIKFSEAVGVSGDAAIQAFDATNTAEDADLAPEGVRITMVNSAGTIIPTAFTPLAATDISRSGTKNDTFEVTVTVETAAIPTGTAPLDKVEVRVSVPRGAVYSLAELPSGGHSLINGGDNDESDLEKFMLVKTFTPETVKQVPFTITGTPSVTDDFTVTFTADEEGAVLMQEDIDHPGGTIINFGKLPFPPDGQTVYQVIIRPMLHTQKVSVTIKKSATTAIAVEGEMGMIEISIGEATITDISAMPATADDTADFEVYFTFDRVLPSQSTPTLEHLSIGTMAGMTAATNDMMDGDEANDTVATAKDPKFLGTPNRVPGETMKWRVTVSPKSGSNTIVGLSDAGMDKYTYGSGVKVLTVMKATAATTTDDPIVAAYDTATMTTTITEGVIGAHDFVVIRYAALPDLELFFDVGGSINLDDGDAADDKNSRTVVISEILWGIDVGEVLAMQTRYQFIELYNTTAANIDLAGWTLTFTRGNVRPAIDIDQVSNRGPGGWEVDTGDTGKSGHIANTTAEGLTAVRAPSRLISMYRNINYVHVKKEATKETVKRDELVKGIPGGNAKGSWKNSQLYLDHRWILSTPGAEHHKRDPILTASSLAGSPFIINEIGNDTGGDNDWVELHNNSDAAQSLKNYALTMVTAKGTDKVLFKFTGDDWDKRKIPSKGFVVISTRHPSLTDLATGKDITIVDEDELNKGLSHLYVVREGWDLQDNGNFALILRNAHDKQGKAEALIDVVAARSGAFTDTNTSLWPLKLGGNPHENVIDGGDENFGAGKVYQRNSGNGRSEKNFAVAGYTGIGYDVKAAKVSSNHGTPGYANNANRAKLAATEGDVTISEIMFDRGDSVRRPLPQWIEIHNSSDTLGVNLNGWKIHIENATEEDGDLLTNTFFATVTLGEKTILPNQVLLVASRSGEVDDPNHFPPTRVVNLWTNRTHREALEMESRNDAALSTRGFNIKLVNKDNETVDEVGNLDGNRRSRDEPAWALPMYDDPDSRSSILRVYEDKVALKGTMEKSWRLASDTILLEDAHEYYGNADDVSSPGYRHGGPVPVSLSKFRPERLKDTGEIVVRWITESELNNAGFNILRSEKRDGEFTKVHFEAGQGTTSERNVYEWKDKTAKPNVVYYYQIQDVSLDGNVTTLRVTHLRGNVTAAGKLTTIWGEIKALQ